MRLSINGWHPIASHLVCIITGIAFSNMMNQQVRASSPQRGQFTFSLLLDQVKTRKKIPESGLKVNIYRIQGQHPECKMFKNPIKVKKLDTELYFTTVIDDQYGLHYLQKEIKLRKKVGVDKHLPKIPLCRTKPKVQYGS